MLISIRNTFCNIYIYLVYMYNTISYTYSMYPGSLRPATLDVAPIGVVLRAPLQDLQGGQAIRRRLLRRGEAAIGPVEPVRRGLVVDPSHLRKAMKLSVDSASWHVYFSL